MDQPRHSGSRRRRAATAVAGSLVAHGVMVAALLSARSAPVAAPEPVAIDVALVAPQVLAPSPKESSAPAPPKTAAAPPPPPVRLAKVEPPPEVVVRHVRPEPPRRAPPDPSVVLAAMGVSAGASGDGGGGSGGDGAGGGCDLVRRLQADLQRDSQVMGAVAGRPRGPGGGGDTIPVWNGAWVRSGGEDGEGLAVIREAIILRVFSAPEACRTAPMHGPVLIRLAHSAGPTVIALGAREWRWADLLQATRRGL